MSASQRSERDAPEESLRIVMTIHHFLDRASGASGTTLALAEAYEALGHVVEVLGFDGLGLRDERLAMLAFPAAVATRLWRRRSRVDVIDASAGDAAWWCRVRPTNSAVLVVRCHGLEHTAYAAQQHESAAFGKPIRLRYRTYQERVILPRVARTLRCADSVLVYNDVDAEFAVQRLGVGRARVQVMDQGVDDFVVDAGARRDLGASTATIVSIATLNDLKGAQYLVPAVSDTLRALPEARMVLLGTGADAGTVRARFPAEVRSRVDVVPKFTREELVGLVGSARVGVVSSVSEAGPPVALLELMALGVAPVASALPGIPTVITPDTGVLVPPRQPEELSRALRAVVGDVDRAARLGANARAAVARHRWSVQAAENVARYRTLLAARSSMRAP